MKDDKIKEIEEYIKLKQGRIVFPEVPGLLYLKHVKYLISRIRQLEDGIKELKKTFKNQTGSLGSRSRALADLYKLLK